MDFVSLARLINPYHVIQTNQILLTVTIRKATQKGYTKSVMRKLIHIQRVPYNSGIAKQEDSIFR